MKNEYKVTTKYNKDLMTQDIGFDDGGAIRDITREVIKLQEQGVREALINLGWTPPESIADVKADAVMGLIASDLGFAHSVSEFESEWVYSEDDVKDHANKIKGAE